MSLWGDIKRTGGNLVHDAEHTGGNLVHGASNAVQNTTNFIGSAGDTFKRGITDLKNKTVAIGSGIIHGTEFVGKKIGSAAIKNLQFQASVTRFGLEKTFDGLKTAGSFAKKELTAFAKHEFGDPNPPGAQGLSFAETKSATNLAYGAKQGEIYRFPDGKTWQVADVSEDKSTGFRAVALKPTDPTDHRTIVAFAGTDPKSGKDWGTDIAQGTGFMPKQYKEAVDFANKWKAVDGNNVTLTGHSLGGGLASYASISTGLRATALNSAPLTLNHLGGNPLSSSVRNNPRITQYYVPGEVLTNLDGINPLDVRPGNKIAVMGKYPSIPFAPGANVVSALLNHSGGSAAPGIPDPVKVN